MYVLCVGGVSAQSVKNVQGTYYDFDANKKAKSNVPAKVVGSAKYGGKEYPLYQSARGSMYIMIVSKAGKPYKKYLPKNKD
jgi:hypothetical protein